MNAFSRNWQILKNAMSILSKNKKLVVFPLIIGIFLSAVFVLFFFWGGNTFKSGIIETNFFTSGRIFGFLAAYFFLMFVMVFCHVALYNELIMALNQQPISLRRGLKVAVSKIKVIFLWSLLSSVVGVILEKIGGENNPLGKVAAAVLGTVWSLGCIFIIPVIIREENTINPIEMLKRSVRVIRQAWGESVTGFIGMQLIMTLPLLIFIPVFFWLFLHQMFASILILSIFMPLGALILILVRHTYVAALYIYATEGVVPGGFNKELLDSAWNVRSNRPK